MGLPIYANGFTAQGRKKAEDTIPQEAQNPTNQEPKGGDVKASTWNTEVAQIPSFAFQKFTQKYTSLPFGQPIQLSSIAGPTYITAQTLVQEVAYSLSDKIFSYSPESFDLDVAARDWAAANTPNSHGYVTQVTSLQTRSGAGAIALGYLFSKDFDLSKRHIPQSLLAPSASLRGLRSTLDQLSLLYSVASPFVAHVAALDYAAPSGLVTDYVTALDVAEELGLGLVCSSSAYEVQHMALFSTLLAMVLPTIHTYDGIAVGRDTLRVIDVLSQTGLANVYDSVLAETSKFGKKKTDVESKVSNLLDVFNSDLGTAYGLFEYHGHKAAQSILVVFGSVEASIATQVAEKLASEGSQVGVINVRVYRPFVEEAFLAALPSTVRSITVLGQVMDQVAVVDGSTHSSLYEDVLAATYFSNKFATAPLVVDHKYPRETVFTPTSIAAIMRSSSGEIEDVPMTMSLVNEEQVEQYIFWDIEDSEAATAPVAISKYCSLDSKNNVYMNQTHDNLVQGGIVRTDIRVSKKSIEMSYPIHAANAAYIGNEKLLKDIDVINSVKDGGTIIIKLPGIKDEDLEKRLPDHVRQAIQAHGLELLVLDPSLSGLVEQDASIETIFAEVAFLQVAGIEALGSAVKRLASVNADVELLQMVLDDLHKVVRKIEIPETWAQGENKDIAWVTRNINTSSFTGFEKQEVEAPSLLHTWQSAAKVLIFKELYQTETALRPDLAVKTYEITVSENRRLTPVTYDRNIFHIEFDIGSSGLKYEIGEALGIHAENPRDEVEEFIDWYGLDPSSVVELPSRDDASVLETRTIFQHLIHNIDIFGKPPKRFYEALADYASDVNEKKDLLTLGGPEGGGEFKRRAEVDTITYSDILQEFPSARPPFPILARLIAPLKRREYSIASSQAVSPHSIALMIVLVSWVDPKGRDRFGRATKYLSALRPGATVTVSVKPSVMKLPTSPTAPLIMAGLGTGLAPFRAFVQYRAMQKAQGVNIGPILLYMGSRHQREEYLYGEEWEAYLAAGVITLLGRAFSRDQKEKIYIQDRMRETMDGIVEAWVKREGSFYLCGPTWPVPDVQAVLEEALRRDARQRGVKRDAGKEIERLKEGGRYVLEVY